MILAGIENIKTNFLPDVISHLLNDKVTNQEIPSLIAEIQATLTENQIEIQSRHRLSSTMLQNQPEQESAGTSGRETASKAMQSQLLSQNQSKLLNQWFNLKLVMNMIILIVKLIS